ncbi:rho guanine nucleotide exchange factor [Pelomyxa schiedti]|nr:rho guanine nucleotide exchange factor [Pelomyxa schiedti]
MASASTSSKHRHTHTKEYAASTSDAATSITTTTITITTTTTSLSDASGSGSKSSTRAAAKSSKAEAPAPAAVEIAAAPATPASESKRRHRHKGTPEAVDDEQEQKQQAEAAEQEREREKRKARKEKDAGGGGGGGLKATGDPVSSSPESAPALPTAASSPRHSRSPKADADVDVEAEAEAEAAAAAALLKKARKKEKKAEKERELLLAEREKEQLAKEKEEAAAKAAERDAAAAAAAEEEARDRRHKSKGKKDRDKDKEAAERDAAAAAAAEEEARDRRHKSKGKKDRDKDKEAGSSSSPVPQPIPASPSPPPSSSVVANEGDVKGDKHHRHSHHEKHHKGAEPTETAAAVTTTTTSSGSSCAQVDEKPSASVSKPNPELAVEADKHKHKDKLQKSASAHSHHPTHSGKAAEAAGTPTSESRHTSSSHKGHHLDRTTSGLASPSQSFTASRHKSHRHLQNLLNPVAPPPLIDSGIPPPDDSFLPPILPPDDGILPPSMDIPPPSLEIPPPSCAAVEIPPPPVWPAKDMRKREFIAKEVLTTENTYLANLTSIVDLFITPFKAGDAKGLSGEDIFRLFSNVAVIKQCHTRMRKSVAECVENWNQASCMGKVFLANVDFIKLYKYYVNNHTTAVDTLAKCKESYPDFKKYMDSLDWTPALGNLNLEGLLITPVQRVPRYVLLLSDMLGATPKDHPDNAPLREALEVVRELATYINQRKRDAEDQKELEGVSEKIKGYEGDIKINNRRFIKGGMIQINKTKNHVWLFNDMFLFTTPEPKKGQYTFKQKLLLTACQLQEDEGGNETKMKFGFTLYCAEGVFKCIVTTKKEKDEWVKAIRLAVSEWQSYLLKSLFVDQNDAAAEGSKLYSKAQEENNEKKRHGLVENMFETERVFVEDLTHTFRTFVRVMVDTSTPDESRLLPLPQAKVICGNFEALLTEHDSLLADIQQRLKEWDTVRSVTDLFEKRLEQFREIYLDYVTHRFEQVSAIDAAVAAYPDFSQFLDSTETGTQLVLKTQLANPLKRISEYYLTCQEMLLYTMKKHPDFGGLNTLVAALKALTEEINNASVKSVTTAVATRKKEKGHSSGH